MNPFIRFSSRSPVGVFALADVPLLFMTAFAPGAQAQNFVRVTDPAHPFLTDAYESGGASWIDLVGDGALDVFVANGNLSIQPNTLYRNTRAGSFVRVVTGPVAADGGSSIGGAFGDFDHDGRPDLFVTNRNNFGNFLYRGLGDTLFEKVTAVPPVTDIANSNSSSWVDVDGDGDLDLYVVNFNGPDYLYINSGGPGFTFARRHHGVDGGGRVLDSRRVGRLQWRWPRGLLRR